METVKMPDNADLIEKCEDEIWQIINRMQREGVRYSVVHGMFVEMVKTLEVQGYVEEWLDQNIPKN